MKIPFVRTGLVWWKWSVVHAVIIGGLELLALGGIALAGDIEFAVLGAYFVVSATAVALLATALLIAVWLLLVSLVPLLKSNRWWLCVYLLIVSGPLYFGPLSLYEFALAAPTLLGFVLPRYVFPKLTKSQHWAC